MQCLVLKSQRCYSALIRREIQEIFPKARIHVAQEARSALEICARLPIQLAIVGARTEDLDGLDYIPMLAESPFPKQIVLLTERKDHRLLRLVDEYRLDGLLDANTEDPYSINAALSEIVRGKRYYSKNLLPLVRKSRRDQSLLSKTEQRVISVLGAAVDNATAGILLGISEHTVRTHRNRIQKKLNLPSKSDLIHYAINNYYTRITPTCIQFPGFEETIDRSALPRGHSLRK